MAECHEVMAVTFAYGQKHAVEMIAAKKIAKKYDIPLLVIDLKPVLSNMTSSALITHGDTTEKHPLLKDLPASFVPVRNALFLTVAYGLAMEHKCDLIYTGVCQTDYSGYPDCRDQFIKSLNEALDLGYQSGIAIVTPLMWLTKAQTFDLAEKVNILATVLEYSVTCYEGDTATVNPWGQGCGECPACKLRMKGWNEYKAGEIDA
jgi:7-cyano-7-deazaguanine synthase